MNPTFWLVALILLLAVECVVMNLMALSFAPGALVATVMCFIGLPAWMEVIAFGVISAFMLIVIRPILAHRVNRHKRQARYNQMIGRDAIVICEIENAHGVGVVNIGGREFRARSNRPNAIISEGTKVKVIEMKGDIAIVDDGKRRSTGRIDIPDSYNFLESKNANEYGRDRGRHSRNHEYEFIDDYED